MVGALRKDRAACQFHQYEAGSSCSNSEGHWTLCTCTQSMKMACHPSAKAVTFDNLKLRYGTLQFQDILADFITQVNNPGARGNTLCTYAEDTLIPFHQVPVFHFIKFTATGNAKKTGIIDSVYAWPEQRDAYSQIIPSYFDTVLVQNPSQDTNQGQVKGNFIWSSVNLADQYSGSDTGHTCSKEPKSLS